MFDLESPGRKTMATGLGLFFMSGVTSDLAFSSVAQKYQGYTNDQIREILRDPDHVVSGGAESALQIAELCLWISLITFVVGAVIEQRSKKK